MFTHTSSLATMGISDAHISNWCEWTGLVNVKALCVSDCYCETGAVLVWYFLCSFTESQAKIRSVKISLSSCKSLLRCKRDELKRLWLEDVKYKNMLQMIDSM